MRVPDDWFVEFHHGLAARFWQAAGASMLERDFAIVDALLPHGRVLDVPCGDGRLTERLAATGREVVGVDIAPGALALAPPGLDLRLGDLRALPDLGTFDAAISWGNSFGYVTPADTARSLAGLRRAVRPGGTLVLESGAIAESLLSRPINAHATHDAGGVRMTATRTYRASESRLEVETVFEAGGEVEHGRAAYYVHTAGEVVRMLNAAGFERVELRSDDGPYELGSGRMIAVAS